MLYLNRKFILLITVIVFVLLISYKEWDRNKEQATNSEIFDQIERPAWLLFHSNGCNACVEMKALYDDLQPEYQTDIHFYDLLMEDSANDKLIKEYNVYLIPTSVFIDKNGNVTYSQVGSIPEEMVRGKLDEIKGEKNE